MMITMRTKKKAIGFALIAMILVYVLFSTVRIQFDGDDYDGDNDAIRPYEVEYRDLKLASSQRAGEVPVVVVDQHQEVIPYWYKAVEEGLIAETGNTVVHIDAHSDMATPYFTKRLQKFDARHATLERHFLPMMMSNDVFLMSAILKGLVNRVIWVKPDWSNNKRTISIKGYVGLTRVAMKEGRSTSSRQMICTCEQDAFKKTSAHDPLQCAFQDPAHPLNNMTVIPVNKCRKIHSYKFIEISESNFLRDIDFKKSLSLFVDIDEDFFGVESGVENFLAHGVSVKTQKVFDAILPRLYVPESVAVEMALNEKLRGVFTELTFILKKHVSPAAASSYQRLRARVRDVIVSATGEFFKDSSPLHELVIFLLTLSPLEMDSLSKAHYCSLNSARLVRNERRTEFSLCHGNIYPNDEFVDEFFLGSEEEIEKRGDSLSGILQHIHKSTAPKFYTVARSLRDGYVPREQQRLIERVLLRSVDEVERLMGRRRKTVYDPFLSFGKKGWIGS